MRRSWRLNERHYGALQGKDKKQTTEEFGEEQFMLWRRSVRRRRRRRSPTTTSTRQAGTRAYADLGDELPRTECLKDVIDRLLPYWTARSSADLRRAGHVAGRRARQQPARASSSTSTASATTTSPASTSPPACPCVYELDDDLRPTRPGEYLDPEAAAAAAAAVANQGIDLGRRLDPGSETAASAASHPTVDATPDQHARRDRGSGTVSELSM